MLKKELKAETSELVETTKFIVPPINYTLKNDITFQNNKMTIRYASKLISNYDYFNDVISIDNQKEENVNAEYAQNNDGAKQ